MVPVLQTYDLRLSGRLQLMGLFGMPWSYIRVPSWCCIFYLCRSVVPYACPGGIRHSMSLPSQNPLCCVHTPLAVSHDRFSTSAVSHFPECCIVGVAQYLVLAHQFLWLSVAHICVSSMSCWRVSVPFFHLLPATWQIGWQCLSYITLDLHSSQTVPRQLYPSNRDGGSWGKGQAMCMSGTARKPSHTSWLGMKLDVLG